MRVVNVFEVPGFEEAVLKEGLIRDAAFLPVLESIGGIKVKPMTLTHYMLLRLINSPLLPPYRTPTAAELASFLWVVSPKYSPDVKAFGRFLRECRIFTPPKMRPKIFRTPMWKRRGVRAAKLLEQLAREAREYVDEALMDRPGAGVSQGYQPEFISDAAHYSDLFGREYGYSTETVLSIPLKCMFQLVNAIKMWHSERPVLFNPISERVINEYIRKQESN